MHHSHRSLDFFLGALMGGAVATLTTLLFTTKKGAQMKDMVVEKCQRLEKEISDGKEKVEETVNNAQDAFKKGFQKTKKDE